MIQARGFSGKLNQDDSPFRLPSGDYTDALNVTRDSQGAGNDEIIANVPGNEVVNYAFLAGTNKVIGNYADKVRNRQYIFVWNSSSCHEITYYDISQNIIVKVIRNRVDTYFGEDVLNFNSSYKINHIDIIYRDEEGDLLYWTDGFNPPRKINVKTATTGGYGPIKSSYIDVAKEPPTSPPTCNYINDLSVTINNLHNKQFKFKYRFVFDDFEKSVTSAQSEVPIPIAYSVQNIVPDPTKNCAIRITIQTGEENVKKIEILGAESLGVSYSDFFLITVLDKQEQSIPSNTITTFDFYNNQAYNVIPIKESIQPFDLVPIKAYTQSLPNGNVLDYGAITENYDLIVPNFEIEAQKSIVVFPIGAAQFDSRFAYDWFSRYSYGVVYFDEKGRTNGVITSTSATVQTFAYDETGGISIPRQVFKINNRPPSWAYYFNIVRTKNLSKSNFIYWVSERTFKDLVPNTNGFQYAYIAIGTLTQYVIDTGAKALGYEFVAGDRIRFVLLYSGTLTTTAVFNDKDFEIIESLTNPEINGQVVSGQVIKILLPTTSVNFDFGANQFNNYLIELYTPALNYSNDNNIYYEFGEKYQIGNPGTSIAYHFGMTQNQTPNLSQPAIYDFIKGDSYFRKRDMPIGGYIKYKNDVGYVNAQSYTGGTVVLNNNNNSIYVGQNWLPFVSQWNAAYFPLLYTSAVSFDIRIKGVLTFLPDRNLNQGNILLYTAPVGSFSLNFLTALFTNPSILPLVNGQEKTVLFDQIVTLPGGVGQRGFYWQLSGVWGTIKNWEITILPALAVRQGIIDPNFSDNYESSASPNGRAWKVDVNAVQTFNPTLIRFGDEFQPGTTVNNTNRFYEENFDVYDRSKGSIKKMFIEGRNQYIFQQFDVGVVTILTQIVRDTAGNPLSAQSDKLLNKIVYPYQGGYGIGEFPESFAYGKNAKYFIDGNKGVVCRLAQNGMTPISIVYKMNAFFVPRIAKYKDSLVPVTGRSTIYGAFDAYTNKYIIGMEQILYAEEYPSVSIGLFETISGPISNIFKERQVWMSSNWDGTTYRNGDPIPQVQNPLDWANLTTGAWCYYNNNPATGAIYGKLYNWYAINDPRGFAPEGWKVPSDSDINTLWTWILFQGGSLKQTGTTNWNSPNTGATNLTGWTGLPGGYRDDNGQFFLLQEKGFFMTSNSATNYQLSYNSNNLDVSMPSNPQYGISVRLLQDPVVSQDAKTISFLETATNKEGFESFLSFLPENMGALNNQFFSFKAGQIWKHLTPDPISGTPAFCNFYNTQYSAEVQVVFNETPLMKKYFLSIMESANTAWECPTIESQLESYSGTPQLSVIPAARFKLLEGQYYSAIFRDINSKGGLINGAIMHGNYLIVRFKKDQASTFVYLNAVSLNYKESPLNLR